MELMWYVAVGVGGYLDGKMVLVAAPDENRAEDKVLEQFPDEVFDIAPAYAILD